MRIRITGTAAEIASEVEQLSTLYHVVSESRPQACRSERGQLRVYLEIATPGLTPGVVLLTSADAEHALAALHALGAEKPEGLDPHSVRVAERVAAAIASAAGRSAAIHPATVSAARR